MLAQTDPTPIDLVMVRVTAADKNNDWLLVSDDDGGYTLKPGESIELPYSPDVSVFGLTEGQQYEIEYLICS